MSDTDQERFARELAEELASSVSRIVDDPGVTSFRIGKTKDLDSRRQKAEHEVITLHAERQDYRLVKMIEMQLIQRFENHVKYQELKDDSSLRPVHVRPVHVCLSVWR